jgi:hypothetical protein
MPNVLSRRLLPRRDKSAASNSTSIENESIDRRISELDLAERRWDFRVRQVRGVLLLVLLACLVLSAAIDLVQGRPPDSSVVDLLRDVFEDEPSSRGAGTP